MRPTYNLTKLRTTTALCVVSTMAIATASYAAGNWSLSGWDSRSHASSHNDGNGKQDNHTPANPADAVKTASPIKHVIVLIGENRGLDHTFGVYKPKGAGQTISNLLSKGIVNEDGTPGPNFAQAQQYSVAGQPSYYIGAPAIAQAPYNVMNVMPQPNTNGAPTAQSATGAPFQTIAQASVEQDMNPASLDILTTGATGLPTGSLDTRVPGAGTLVGPFPMQGPQLTDDDYTGDTTHRFYQDWQQEDCGIANATPTNTSGCKADLFPFVMATYSSGKSLGNSMGFYNVQQGQAPVLKQLADRFTLADNFHQSFHGGTGANHFMLGTGDAAFWSDGNGNAIAPPSSVLLANPNPVSGTVNKYTADGNWSACADASQPGVGPIVNYLNNLPYAAEPNCQPNHYYMLNNVNPGYLPNGKLVGWYQHSAVAGQDHRRCPDRK